MNTPYELIGRYLAGECNDNEREQIQQWARQHPDLMDEYVRLWQQASGKEFHPDVEQALRKVNQRIDKKEKKTPKRLYLAISSVAAAVILLLISVTGIRYWDAANDVRTSTCWHWKPVSVKPSNMNCPTGVKYGSTRHL